MPRGTRLQLNATQTGEKHDQVVQKDQDDATFLMERAKRIDYDCYIANDPVSGQATLNFTVPTDSREGQKATYYEFIYGTSSSSLSSQIIASKQVSQIGLISFSPQLTLSKQVSKVTVRGWDPKTKQSIVATSTPADLPGGGGGGTSGPASAEANFPDKQDVVVDSPVTSAQEARELAISLLRERAYEFITGSGQVIGVPELRPGYNVRLSGLGQRFTVDYYVKKVEHTLGSSGYTTNFEVRSTYDGGLKHHEQRSRVPRSTDKRFYGVVEGLVTDNADPDREGKVRVNFPWFDARRSRSGAGAAALRGLGYGSSSFPRSATRWSSASPRRHAAPRSSWAGSTTARTSPPRTETTRPMRR